VVLWVPHRRLGVLIAVSALCLLGIGVAVYQWVRVPSAWEIAERHLGDARLDSKVACALVESEARHGRYEEFPSYVGFTRVTSRVEEVKCDSAPVGDEKRAALYNLHGKVLGEQRTLTACLARGRRWFVLSFVDANVACPTVDLPEPSHSVLRGEDELIAEEEALRERVRELEQMRAVETFRKDLLHVKEAVKNSARANRVCPTLRPSKRMATVDLDWIDHRGGETQRHWGFMTTSWARDALNEREKAEIRWKGMHYVMDDGGGYIVVYVATRRIDGGAATANQFVPYSFDGWMLIVDAKAAQISCEHELAFENSEHVTGLFMGNAVADDLRANFDKATSKTIREMTDKELRVLDSSFGVR
jgi:hypothetical protein